MRRLRRPEHVAMVDVRWEVPLDEEDTAVRPLAAPVYLGTLPGGPLLVLQDTASLIYRSCLSEREDGVVEAVAQATGQQAEAISSDVRHFIDELFAFGVLEPEDEHPTGG